MNRFGLMVALGIFIFFILLLLIYFKSKTIPPAQKINATVLVAARNLSRGTMLKEADLSWRPMPKEKVSPDFIIEGTHPKEEFIGSIVRTSIATESPITPAVLIAKGSLNPVMGVLRAGMRAFTIDIHLASALAGLVQPGDTVDIILVEQQPSSGGGAKYTSRTILHSISVIAVDQDLSPVEGNSKERTTSTKKITLEVTPEQAELLAVSHASGTLSLSLSPPQLQPETTLPEEGKNKTTILLLHGGERVEQAQ